MGPLHESRMCLAALLPQTSQLFFFERDNGTLNPRIYPPETFLSEARP
jgi:hypothetical protein